VELPLWGWATASLPGHGILIDALKGIAAYFAMEEMGSVSRLRLLRDNDLIWAEIVRIAAEAGRVDEAGTRTGRIYHMVVYRLERPAGR